MRSTSDARLVGNSIDGLLHAARARKRSRRAAFAATLVALTLSFPRHRERGSQPLVVDDIGLANLTQVIKDGVGEFSPFVADLEPPVRIIEYSHVLSRDLVVLGAGLNQVDDFIVLQGQRACDSSGLLPAEDVIDPDSLGLNELAMRVLIRGGRPAETRVVIASERLEERVPLSD
jgi:hypothetical protein